MNLKLREAVLRRWAAIIASMLQGLCNDVGIKSKPVALNLPRQDDKLHQDEDDHVGDRDDDGGDLDSKNGDNYENSSGSVWFSFDKIESIARRRYFSKIHLVSLVKIYCQCALFHIFLKLPNPMHGRQHLLSWSGTWQAQSQNVIFNLASSWGIIMYEKQLFRIYVGSQPSRAQSTFLSVTIDCCTWASTMILFYHSWEG